MLGSLRDCFWVKEQQFYLFYIKNASTTLVFFFGMVCFDVAGALAAFPSVVPGFAM
jgi:fumarate reductase subunit C